MTDTNALRVGLIGTAEITVEYEHTAEHVGSGCEAVLATPVMIALMESAAVDCTEHLLEPGYTSLGIRIAVDHVAPTPIGRTVTASAELVEIKGRRLFFRVTAEDGVRPIGSGEHVRATVAVEEFRKRLVEPAT
ncbi:MAG: thioesterase family protein [Hyphomicrobium sp.]|nr:thioesterase family protein [Hyphomicrobium sp.]